VSLNCDGLPNWVQSLAGIYGFVFAECNPNNVAMPQATMRAAAGARVTDVAAQIDAQVAAGGFRDGDLATVLAGTHDVIDLYEQFPTRTEDDLKAAAADRGRQVAEQVNRAVNLGARVIVSTIPDLGYTPYALKQSLLFTDTNRAALLSRLTQAFNEKLQLTILLDGRYVGLVQADLRTQSMARSPTSYGLSNVFSGVCLFTVPLVDCSDQTLVEGGSASAWLWADDLWPAYSLQQQIASLAIDRARNNPF
jgi:outer membrane lipase/esterase